jgi:putative RNA 2'-phosphotransferase
MNSKIVKTSKFLSLILRHKPETIAAKLDSEGWLSIDELIAKSKTPLTRELIEEVVVTNDKKRFTISEDGNFIRASQGHSINVDLQFKAIEPPSILYHGTATRFLASILKEGLTPQNRQHVHLSATKTTAVAVGKRHGKPVILTIDAASLFKGGQEIYLSENSVWLTNAVPVSAIKVES